MHLQISKHNFVGTIKKNYLEMIVKHIVLLYYSIWFDIKCKPSILNDPHYIYKGRTIVCNVLPKEICDIVKKQLNHGALYAHSKNFLSFLSGEDYAERQFAVKKKKILDFVTIPKKLTKVLGFFMFPS